MKLEILQRALFIALAAVLFSCPSSKPEPTPPSKLPILTTDNPAAERALRVAQAHHEAGRLEEARAHYSHFIANYEGDALIPVAHLGLAQLYLGADEFDRAVEHSAPQRTHEDVTVRERATLIHAVASLRLGKPDIAVLELKPMVGKTTDPQDTGLLLWSLAEAEQALGNPAEAVVALDRLLGTATPVSLRDPAIKLIQALIEDALAKEKLDVLIETLPRDGVGWPLATKRAIELAYEESRMNDVRQLAKQLEQQDIELDDDLRLMVVRAKESHDADPYVIGAILPLSGRAREVGQDALRGMVLAAGLPRDGPPTPTTPRIIFRDDAGDPKLAREAVEELVAVHKVIAIVGPLSTKVAEEAARQSERLAVPLVALSPNMSPGPAYASRLLPSTEQEAQVLLDSASLTAASDVVLMAPKSAFGDRMVAAYRANLAARGVQQVTELRFEPEATSFGDATKALQGKRPDALAVLAQPSRVLLIAPALARIGIGQGGRTRILLPSIAYDGNVLRSAGRYLQGALVSAADNPNSAFAQQYRARFETEPGLFALAAHDAVKLILTRSESGTADRDQMATALRSAPLTHELAGPWGGISEQGEPRIAIRVWKISGSQLKPAQ